MTVIVKVVEVPSQIAEPFVKRGVTVIVAVTGAVPVLTAVNEAISPVPLADNPMEGVLLVQRYVVPTTAPPNVTAAVLSPLHTNWLDTAFTVGVGFTVIVNVFEEPVQDTEPLVKVGVTVMVAVTGDVPVLTAVNAAIFPAPLAPRPIAVLSFVQL